MQTGRNDTHSNIKHTNTLYTTGRSATNWLQNQNQNEWKHMHKSHRKSIELHFIWMFDTTVILQTTKQPINTVHRRRPSTIVVATIVVAVILSIQRQSGGIFYSNRVNAESNNKLLNKSYKPIATNLHEPWTIKERAHQISINAFV